MFGLIAAICVAQVGSLFAADAWNNITFTAGEVKNPRRNVPLSLALGVFIVIGLYVCANAAYALSCRWRKFSMLLPIAWPARCSKRFSHR